VVGQRGSATRGFDFLDGWQQHVHEKRAAVLVNTRHVERWDHLRQPSEVRLSVERHCAQVILHTGNKTDTFNSAIERTQISILNGDDDKADKRSACF